jgi:alpha-beta hydrolase superfamily lysophospholipase
MGGWLALLLARRLQKNNPQQLRRIRGMVLLAPATDMTQDLMWDIFSEDMRQTLTHEGRIAIPSEYGPEPYVITKALIEDGMQHLLLEEGLSVSWPVRILQGEADADVPWRHGLKTFEALAGDDVTFTLVKDADHRLSTPRDLQMLGETVLALCARADKASRTA